MERVPRYDLQSFPGRCHRAVHPFLWALVPEYSAHREDSPNLGSGEGRRSHYSEFRPVWIVDRGAIHSISLQ